MKIGIPKESGAFETRCALVPETVSKLVKAGIEVHVESRAGEKSYIDDQDFAQVGAIIDADLPSLLHNATILMKVNRPQIATEINNMPPGMTLIAPLDPFRHPKLVTALLEKNITAFALDLVPRIARAQSMDILSSMSNLAGYKSVMLAAAHLEKIFPMLTTAAGTIMPAKVMVIGAGVAGLQAIATARRLGAVVKAFDTRPIVAEQVKSLGAEFISLETSLHDTQDSGGYAKEQNAEFYKNEQDIIRKYLKEADVIITTALIPGKPAPLLITEDMIKEMQNGSVIVDLASEQGGNCALTKPGEIVSLHQVTIIGLLNLQSTLAKNASQLYARNMLAFFNYVAPQVKEKKFDLNDDIIKSCLITHDGQIIHPMIAKQFVTVTE